MLMRDGISMTTETKLALIASRHEARKLRRALLVRIYINQPITFNGGKVIRVSQRTLRYEVDGETVVQYTGKWETVAKKMLEYLGCWSQADSERETELIERIEDEKVA